MYFHDDRFSSYEAWLSDPTHIGPSAQRASEITSELQLYCTTIGALVFAALMLFASWFYYHKAAPKLAWFQDVESMLNHHLAGLLGLGSLSWTGHQFCRGSNPISHLQLVKIYRILTFHGGLDPVTGGLWLTDVAHHHLAIALLFLIASQGHKGLYEILTTSWHSIDYSTQLSLFTHHMWIGGFLIVGPAAHAAIFMVRDYDTTTQYNDLLDRVLRHRDAIISHLNWACIFLGFHSFGLYILNDTMSALWRPQDIVSDTAIQLQPIFSQWIPRCNGSWCNDKH
ncbi:photosystem i p700 chlorophyll a apoprotein a1 [Phtheirospermum japonicum]|uniref:Photosystem i p700 chlorophyll a apoprotein a1 n=1 Tax=Phtheirospermum japonicum TaxID=374723 RepID=A0A830CG46_9LAMI|nr:photosystem i p700 chlorophyll a apoprotein a1 [Phtheirospermum japonicum]